MSVSESGYTDYSSTLSIIFINNKLFDVMNMTRAALCWPHLLHPADQPLVSAADYSEAPGLAGPAPAQADLHQFTGHVFSRYLWIMIKSRKLLSVLSRRLNWCGDEGVTDTGGMCSLLQTSCLLNLLQETTCHVSRVSHSRRDWAWQPPINISAPRTLQPKRQIMLCLETSHKSKFLRRCGILCN